MADANPSTTDTPPAPAGLAALLKKAEGQTLYWRDRQIGEKTLEDSFAEDGTPTPIGDVSAWSAGYTNGRYSEADWWQKTIQEAINLATPTGYRVLRRADGGFDVEREVICVNGQPVWFPIAVVPPVSDHEWLVTDGAARTAEENVAVLLNGLGEHVDGGAAAPDVDGQDGTERLCQALYGRKATPRDYLGGSDARMLHDAADRLIKRAPANPALEGF